MKKLKFQAANEKQQRFLNSTKKAILFSGAVGAGKSFLICVKGFFLNLKYPGNRGLICRKENRTLHNSTILTLLEQVIPKEMIVEYSISKGILVHKTGVPGVNSTIVFSGLDKGADQQYPTKIASTEYGWIAVDEGVELDKGDWDMLMTRLRYKIKHLSDEDNELIPRQIFTATNPDAPSHFLYDFFIDMTDEEREKLDREVIYVTPYDNPFLPEGYLRNLESNLAGIHRQRLLEGKWVRAEGVIYDTFDPMKHVTKEGFLPLYEYKDLIVGADANYPLPRAWVLIGLRGDGRIDVLEEYYRENSHVEDAIRWLQNIKFNAKKDVVVYHDPSDPGAIDKINNQGLYAVKADNKVLPGISEVARHFNDDSIMIHSDCVNLIKELQTYRWKPGKDKEVPDKDAGHDHILDALRYALYTHVVGAGKVGVFFDTTGYL